MHRFLPPVLTHARLVDQLERIQVHHTSVCPTVFGRSLLGRPLYMVRVGSESPVMLLVATHHAMEWMCGWLLLDFLDAYYHAVPENKVPRGTYYIVPLLNPDGVELLNGGWQEGDILAPRQRRCNGGSLDFSHWQANGRGVDLNHNYPAGFDAYRAIEASLGIWEGAPTRYSGHSPLSEPETQALASLIDLFVPDVTVSLHTQGEELYAGSATGRSCAAAHLAARRLGYRFCAPTGAACYGGLTDWLTARGMCAMTVECGQGVNPLPPEDYPALAERLLPFFFSLPEMMKYVNNL